MNRHLVVGAGSIGRATARALAARGAEVILASRSGTDSKLPGVQSIAVDARDSEALTAALAGAATLVNATNPSHYYTWEQDWPPVARSMLAACERTGAGLVTVSNLYCYGRVDGPITPDTPVNPLGPKGRVRAEMWAEALAAHEAGRLRATELRASDYFGPAAGPGISVLNDFIIAPAAAGKAVWLVSGTPDAAHSWSYLDDIGELAAVLATDERSWGQPWLVPNAPPKTVREVAAEAAAIAGHPAPPVRPLPGVVRAIMKVSPTVRELAETAPQFEHPFVVDSTSTERTFGVKATSWQQALESTVAQRG